MTATATDPRWPWPDSLDAVEAAPAHHTVVLENAFVRVLDTRVGPGETVPLHTHRWPSLLHVLSFGDVVRRDEHGAVVLDTRTLATKPSGVVWSPPLPPHTLENVGTTPVHVLSVEVKGASA